MERKIHVCFISTRAYPLFNKECTESHGGSELQLYLLSRELAKESDFKVSFIVGDFGQADMEVHEGVNVFRGMNSRANDSLLRKALQALSYLSLFSRIDAEIYFTSSATSVVGLVSLFCILRGRAHVHRTAHEEDVNRARIERRGLLGRIYEFGLTHARLVLTQSETHRRLLKEHHDIDAEVFRNAIPISVDHKRKEGLVLWVGRAVPWKRPELFIELANENPDRRFVMIVSRSDEEPEYWDEIRRETKNIGNLSLKENVVFEKVQAYFNRANVLVNTSDSEGFPNTFLQAGLGRTPILSLNVNPDGFIKEHECGFHCHNDPNELKSKLQVLFENKPVYERCSKNIFDYVKKYHSLDVQSKRMKELFGTLIS